MALTLEAARKKYDKNNSCYIEGDEVTLAEDDWRAGLISADDYKFVISLYVNKTRVCTGTSTPTPTPGTTKKKKSLSEKDHNIEVRKSGYETLKATIRVGSSRVTCVSGPCGGSGVPRVTTSGWTVTVHLKKGTGGVSTKCSWINAQNHSKVGWISLLIKAYYGHENLGFVVKGHSAYITSAIKVYFNHGTIAEEYGC